MSDDDNREFSLTGEQPREARRVRISAEDIEKAQGILRRWLEHAKRTNNKSAEADTRLLMRVVSGLYSEAK